MQDKTPRATSSDHDAMAPYWKAVNTILGGAAKMREAKEYLPKFPDETDKRYEFRAKTAKFTNVFGDIVSNLAQRPFSKMVEVKEGPSDILDFQEDVDGRGNHLHVFAGDVFYNGIASALDWILVDYTSGVPEGATRAQERDIGARPYWVRIPAASMLAAYSDIIDGKEQIVHARFLEPSVERNGWSEDRKERVRVLTRDKEGGAYAPPRWELWEERKDEKTGKREWAMIDEGAITLGEIPLVPFIAGRREGGVMCVAPPMRDAAELQIELYQQESALKYAKIMTAFPMLAGNGVAPPMGEDGKPMPVPVGPHAALFAPPSGDSGSHGEWKFIEPTAESLKFLAADIKETILQLREIGRQPLTAQSGNLTVVTTAFAAQKGNAAIQAWALNLKDALERAMEYTAAWLKIDADIDVTVNTDFDIGYGDEETFKHVLALYTDGLVSREAALHEAVRRGVLDPDYDQEEDLDDILKAMPGDDDEELPIAAE